MAAVRSPRTRGARARSRRAFCRSASVRRARSAIRAGTVPARIARMSEPMSARCSVILMGTPGVVIRGDWGTMSLLLRRAPHARRAAGAARFPGRGASPRRGTFPARHVPREARSPRGTFPARHVPPRKRGPRADYAGLGARDPGSPLSRGSGPLLARGGDTRALPPQIPAFAGKRVVSGFRLLPPEARASGRESPSPTQTALSGREGRRFRRGGRRRSRRTTAIRRPQWRSRRSSPWRNPAHRGNARCG